MLNTLADIHRGLSLYTLPPFLGFLTTLGLTLLAFTKGKGRKTNRLFACLCLIGTCLNIDVTLLTLVKSEDMALRISRYDHILLVYTVPIYLHFVYTLLSIKRMKWLIPAAYLFSFTLMFFTQSQLYLVGTYRYHFGYFAKGGPLFYLFIFINSLTLLYCLRLFQQRMKEEMTPLRRNKIKYAFLGFGIHLILAFFNSLPMSGIAIYPLGNFGFVPTVILAYGVLRHDLLDMGSLIRKGLVYSSVTGLLTGLYAFCIVILDMIFKGTQIAESFIFSILLFLIIVFILSPVKERVQVTVDRVFFKKKYDYRKTLRDVSQAMTTILDMKEILNRMIDAITDSMHPSTVCVLLWDESERFFRVHAVKGRYEDQIRERYLDAEGPLAGIMLTGKKELLRHDIEEGNVGIESRVACLKELDSLHAGLMVPMIFRDTVKGFIGLGYKRSRELYSPEDLELLQTLANQSSISIENARSYGIIEALNKDLEKKIQERTRELQAALSEKERTQEQLIRTESLAAVGQLVAGVAHELNNPLASVSSLIQSTVESLKEKNNSAAGEADIVDDLRFTLKELLRAQEIVGSLLDISRQTTDYTEPVDMNTVVKDALRVLYNEYKRYDLEIVEDLRQGIPEIRGNFANLGQVSLNIIKNAIQEVKDNGGRIILRTQFDATKDKVIFECIDTGRGIPRSIVKDIFKPFFTTKEVGEGTGLGLYISYEIVKRHKGDISVLSKPGNGTTFRVELPAS